mmetsp:Transcript_120170/g.212127  ORF Transcript_120170/g.212127 Transcript_120170/m.212127 type:complete len:212 (+) Transcript_120170:247-882(+)
MRSDDAGTSPWIPINLRGMIVVFKPSAWEVDGKGSQLVTNPEVEDGRIGLSSFVKLFFPANIFPLPHWPEFDHGFLHRLDIPSSGLVLAGTTMEGYYALRLQLNTYRLNREYFVTCHGALSAEFREVNFGIGTTQVCESKSTADEHGKPAKTYVRVLAHAVGSRSWTGPLCIVAIRIRTGRHHQIRTHMLFSDHPAVTDAKYTVLQVSGIG